jgi:hypothetical protein
LPESKTSFFILLADYSIIPTVKAIAKMPHLQAAKIKKKPTFEKVGFF